uniref:Tetratricopeptide repeat protein 30 n=1 Tax=Ascaris suum TaxID=6253 RepID=F1LDJ6_ASCSU
MRLLYNDQSKRRGGRVDEESGKRRGSTICRIGQEKKLSSLYHINLVIGTLYCSKGNYEFGISRVIKAMEPYDKKLGTDTWYYCKRCFVSTIENIAKHIISIRDSVINECLQFLEQCEIYGKHIPTTVDGPLMESQLESAKRVRSLMRHVF